MEGKITNFHVNKGSGLATIEIETDDHQVKLVMIESGFGLRQVARVFGSLQDAVGKRIEYTVDEFGIMTGFNAIDEQGKRKLADTMT